MDIGKEIRRLREAKGWSQAKLAGGADMGVSGISQIETGARNPSAVTLSKIAGALGVEVADLFPKASALQPSFEDAAYEDELYPTVADMVVALAFRQADQYQLAFNRAAESGRAQGYIVRHETEAFERLLKLPHTQVAEACIDIAREYVRLTKEPTNSSVSTATWQAIAEEALGLASEESDEGARLEGLSPADRKWLQEKLSEMGQWQYGMGTPRSSVNES